MVSATYQSLAAVPFNALAKGPTSPATVCGLPADSLWRRTVGLMQEYYNSWGTPADFNSSYYHFLRDRFCLDDWPLDRITRERNAFLDFETRHEITCINQMVRVNHGFLVIDHARGRVVGERRLSHFTDAPETAIGIDIIRPSERGKGLSKGFLELACLLAKDMGYTCYSAHVSSDNPASYKRLDIMVEEGRAQRLPDDWGNGRNTTRRYHIDLQNFRPARCA